MRPVLAVVLVCGCSSEDFGRLQEAAAPVRETSHLVTGRFERRAVVLTVTRTFENPGPAFQQVTQTLALPDGAVATSLRVAGHREELLGADEAQTRWADLQLPGLAEPTVSVLLERRFDGNLKLALFGLAPRSSATVAYDLQLPPTPEAGQWTAAYPDEEGDQIARAKPVFDLTRVPGSVALPGLTETALHFPRAPIDRVDARWGLFRLGADRTLWRFELDAAQVLEPAPVRPNVVFVVDASHSMGPDGIQAQLDLLAPYLASVPDAQVEVVLYRRTATRLFGRFIAAGDVARMVAATPADRLAPGNGSHLEAGARLAADALDGMAGVGRVVLFTDALLRDAFTNDAAITALAGAPRDTVVHVVIRDVSSEPLSEARAFEHPLTPIADATGGIVAYVNGAVDPLDPSDAQACMRELVRPVRVHQFEAEALGMDGDALDVPDTLEEGASERFQAIAERPPTEVKLSGKIWGRDFVRVVPVDADLSGWLPGIALGTRALESQLTDAEVQDAALRTRAVSRMTSYLSVAPGAGPSTIGTEAGGAADHGWGLSAIGCGSRCGTGTGCRFGRGMPDPDFASMLKALLADGIAACARTHGAPARVGAVTIEATHDEVVDVTVAAETADLAACLGEAAWAIRLTDAFVGHRRYEVALE